MKDSKCLRCKYGTFNSDTCLIYCKHFNSFINIDDGFSCRYFEPIYLEKVDEILKKLSKKEREAYYFIKSLDGCVLIRSLEPSHKGALGKLIKMGIGKITTVTKRNKYFKVFKLSKDYT